MAKVKVNHTGFCAGHFYKAGQVVDIPEEVIVALGEGSIERLEKEVKSEVKEAKKPLDTMVKKESVVTK